MTTSRSPALGLVLAALAALAAPSHALPGGAPGQDDVTIEVEVNGTPITRADLEEALATDNDWLALQRQGSSAAANELRRRIEDRVLNALVDEILLLEAAKAAKVALTPEEEREVERLFEERVKEDWGSVEALEQMLKPRGISIAKIRARHRNGFVFRRLLHDEAGGSSFVRPAEIRDYYEANRETYRQPGSIEISQIVVRKSGKSPEDARTLIESARSAIAAGRPFAEVAREYPDGANYELGGKLGYQSLGALRKELQEAVRSLRSGETSPVIETREAYFLVRLDGMTAESFKSFEDVQDEIYKRLEDRARQERLEVLKKRLRDKAFIKRKRPQNS